MCDNDLRQSKINIGFKSGLNDNWRVHLIAIRNVVTDGFHENAVDHTRVDFFDHAFRMAFFLAHVTCSFENQPQSAAGRVTRVH